MTTDLKRLDERRMKLLSTLRQAVSSVASEISQNNNSHRELAQLQMNIPPFSGDPKQLTSFRDYIKFQTYINFNI